MTADISVIVPVYNTSDYLCKCVDSIIASTNFEGMEIILVDDGSTDGSANLCDYYAGRYSNIYAVHQYNAGVSAARNAGIELAAGSYIGFVDSDDYIFPEMYERLLRGAKAINAGACFCDYILCEQESERIVSYEFPGNKALDAEFIKNNIYPFLLGQGSLNTCCNKLFSKALIKKHHLCFAEGRTFGEDRLFTISAVSVCDCVCYIPYTGFYYRYVSNSATKALRMNLMDDFLSEYNDDVEIFQRLGVEKDKIIISSGEKLLRHAVSGLHIITSNLTGQDKHAAMRRIVENTDMQNLLKKRPALLGQDFSRYEKILIHFIAGKNIPGLLAAMWLMRLRIRFTGGETK